MKSFTGTVNFDGLPRGDNLLIIKGASEANPVIVEYALDGEWVESDRFTTDGARIVWFGGCEFRIKTGTARAAVA